MTRYHSLNNRLTPRGDMSTGAGVALLAVLIICLAVMAAYGG